MNKKKKFIVMFDGSEVKLHREDIALALVEFTDGEMLEIIN